MITRESLLDESLEASVDIDRHPITSQERCLMLIGTSLGFAVAKWQVKFTDSLFDQIVCCFLRTVEP